ncbi:hypothetical protein [Arcticibacterium luteifluviistationis]|uniref:Periplasmic heavy metal sensor n=1 Tax=Arcticibacterium luteifluviistationis TaxID=1784714 RepID=A0A2Z4G9Z4_9BACT|nr:hypothetical protein [Arcticibacterium luteifluviistationis]AWV97878.1 hypothetical protein DJ013_06735 [Arcticibacterium luteifluviistationis]
MKQQDFYKYSTIGLLILNLAMVAFFFLTKPKAGQEHRPEQGNPIEILKLNSEQHELFIKSAMQHKENMDKIGASQRALVSPFFNGLIDKPTNSKDSLLQEIQELEKEKIELTYKHFEEIKAILKPEQLASFEPFMKTILKEILSPSKNPPPPPNGPR